MQAIKVICPKCRAKKIIFKKQSSPVIVKLCDDCLGKTLCINGCKLSEAEESRCTLNVDCKHYFRCLDETAKLNWRGWTASQN